MKTSSAKAKGRKLQQWVVSKLIALLGFDEEDVKSTPMGAPGEDVWLAKMVLLKFPYSVEAKNQERVSIWASYEQATSNCRGYEPLLIIKKNGHKPLAVLDAEYFIQLHKEKDE